MEEATKLRDLLPDRFDNLGEVSKKKLREDEDVSRMHLAWDFIESQLSEELKELLDVEIVDLLGKAWASAKKLQEFRDPAKHPPGERELLKFGDFDFGHDFKPTIDVTIGSCPCAKLEFKLKLTGNFSGLYLGIKDGYIVDGKSGKAWGSAQLSYDDIPLHKEKDTKKMALPGRFRFTPPGIEIPALF